MLVKQQKLREETRIKFGHIHYKRLLREKVRLNRHLKDAQDRNARILTDIQNLERESALSGRELSSPSGVRGDENTLHASEATRRLDSAKREYFSQVAALNDVWKSQSAARVERKREELVRLEVKAKDLEAKRAAFSEAFAAEQSVSLELQDKYKAFLMEEACHRRDHVAREEFRASLSRQRAEFEAAVRRAAGDDISSGSPPPLRGAVISSNRSSSSSSSSRSTVHHNSSSVSSQKPVESSASAVATTTTASRDSAQGHQPASSSKAPTGQPHDDAASPTRAGARSKAQIASGLVQVSALSGAGKSPSSSPVDVRAAAKVNVVQVAVQQRNNQGPAREDAARAAHEAHAKRRADNGSKDDVSTAAEEDTEDESEFTSAYTATMTTTMDRTGGPSSAAGTQSPALSPSPPPVGSTVSNDNDSIATDHLSMSSLGNSTNLVAPPAGSGKQSMTQQAALETVQLESPTATMAVQKRASDTMSFPLSKRQYLDAFGLLARRIAQFAEKAGKGGAVAATYALVEDDQSHEQQQQQQQRRGGIGNIVAKRTTEEEQDILQTLAGEVGLLGVAACCRGALRCVRDCGEEIVPVHLWAEYPLMADMLDSHHADEFSGSDGNIAQLWRAISSHLDRIATLDADNDALIDSMCALYANAIIGRNSQRLAEAMTLIRNVCNIEEESTSADDSMVRGMARGGQLTNHNASTMRVQDMSTVLMSPTMRLGGEASRRGPSNSFAAVAASTGVGGGGGTNGSSSSSYDEDDDDDFILNRSSSSSSSSGGGFLSSPAGMLRQPNKTNTTSPYLYNGITGGGVTTGAGGFALGGGLSPSLSGLGGGGSGRHGASTSANRFY